MWSAPGFDHALLLERNNALYVIFSEICTCHPCQTLVEVLAKPHHSSNLACPLNLLKKQVFLAERHVTPIYKGLCTCSQGGYGYDYLSLLVSSGDDAYFPSLTSALGQRGFNTLISL